MVKDIIRDGTWPFRRRSQPYQTLDISDIEITGQRDIKHRLEVMNIPQDLSGKSVLDVGCSMGAFCIEAKRRGAEFVMGFDYQRETIEAARDLVRYLSIDIKYACLNVGHPKILEMVRRVSRREQFDIVFFLSVARHIINPEARRNMFNFIDNICKDVMYFEGRDDVEDKDATYKLLQRLGFKTVDFIGHTEDLQRRFIYLCQK